MVGSEAGSIGDPFEGHTGPSFKALGVHKGTPVAMRLESRVAWLSFNSSQNTMHGMPTLHTAASPATISASGVL